MLHIIPNDDVDDLHFEIISSLDNQFDHLVIKINMDFHNFYHKPCFI